MQETNQGIPQAHIPSAQSILLITDAPTFDATDANVAYFASLNAAAPTDPLDYVGGQDVLPGERALPYHHWYAGHLGWNQRDQSLVKPEYRPHIDTVAIAAPASSASVLQTLSTTTSGSFTFVQNPASSGVLQARAVDGVLAITDRSAKESMLMTLFLAAYSIRAGIMVDSRPCRCKPIV